jgi:chromosome segregation ATPase
MNSPINRAKELRKQLLILETDLISMQAEIEVSNNTIIKLEKIKEDLEFNLIHHRQPETIPIIKEYKKTKEDLQIVQKNMLEWQKKANQLSTKIEEAEKKLVRLRQEYESVFNHIKNDNIILIFKPRDNDGKER